MPSGSFAFPPRNLPGRENFFDEITGKNRRTACRFSPEDGIAPKNFYLMKKRNIFSYFLR